MPLLRSMLRQYDHRRDLYQFELYHYPCARQLSTLPAISFTSLNALGKALSHVCKTLDAWHVSGKIYRFRILSLL
jgi:hypothetical protein